MFRGRPAAASTSAARSTPCTCALPCSSPAASSGVAPGLRLDMVVGDKRLRDQFWWDLHAAEPTPEEFAAELCADMGLDACHGASVAAAIRIEVGAGHPYRPAGTGSNRLPQDHLYAPPTFGT